MTTHFSAMQEIPLWDTADSTSRAARSFSCRLTHLSCASTNTSDITQEVPYNYLEMQIHMNNVYVGLVAELNGILKIHSVHVKKIGYEGIFEGVLMEDKLKKNTFLG